MYAKEKIKKMAYLIEKLGKLEISQRIILYFFKLMAKYN